MTEEQMRKLEIPTGSLPLTECQVRLIRERIFLLRAAGEKPYLAEMLESLIANHRPFS